MSEGDVLGVLRMTDSRLEVEPLDEEGEMLVQEAKDRGRKVTIRTEAQEECPLEPDVPGPLSMCASLADLKAAREGEMDTPDLVERMVRREVLRERWQRGELDEDDLWSLVDK